MLLSADSILSSISDISPSFSFPLPTALPYVVILPLIYVSISYLSGFIIGTYILIDVLNCSALRSFRLSPTILTTMASADFSQFVVTRLSDRCEISQDKP